MPYNPNGNWTNAIDDTIQLPVYYLDIDGLTAHDFSTGPVLSPTRTKLEYLNLPEGGSGQVDLINNRVTRTQITVGILDLDDKATELVAWDRPGADVGTLINRKVTLYAGYVHLVEADYAPIFTGRIRGISMDPDLRLLTLRCLLGLGADFDQDVMDNATSAKPSGIRGNVVNMVWSLLTGIFDDAHADFPLDFVTTDTGGSSVPTGAGIPRALIDEVLLKEQRDAWHPNDAAERRWEGAVNLKTELESEFMRVFQARQVTTELGLLGFKFRLPALPTSTAPTVLEEDHIVEVSSWERLIDTHLNKFTIQGDYTVATDTYEAMLYDTETAEDTADQAATGEIRHLKIQSKWLRRNFIPGTLDDMQGEIIAAELAARSRFLFLSTPVVLKIAVLFAKRNLQIGESIVVTDSRISNVLDGTRGVEDGSFFVTAVEWDFPRGVVILNLMDTRYVRYGVIAPNGEADYTGATNRNKNTYCYVGRAADNKVGAGADPGYQIL